MKKYPDRFLGRCATCLDNATLNSAPCRTGYGNGDPVTESDCLIRSARKAYDEKQSASERVDGGKL